MLFFFLSLLSDSNQRPRDYKSRALPTELKRRVGKLTISRRYNQLPLLRSSPGGFEGAGRIGLTRFAVAKVGIFMDSAIAVGNFFA